MGAPTGNKFWELRSKHGRDKLFNDPELFWQECTAYFQYCEDNPWLETDWVGKDAFEVQRKRKVPYTWQGLALYLDCSVNTIKDLKNHSNEDFLMMLTRVEQTIYSQKLTGAANGFFNANIISRDLGLAEKTESKVETNIPDWMQQGIPKPDA